MAGETQKSTALTNRDAGTKRRAALVKGRVYETSDGHSFAAATELEAADNIIFDMPLPSNCYLRKIEFINDDMDTAACPTLVVDVGLAAAQDYKSVTSGTATFHQKDDIIDADLLIDGSTQFQAATTVWTDISAYDATTWGPDDQQKPLWELLGYDEDPRTTFNLVLQSQAAAAALGSAADLKVRVMYVVD